MRCRHGSIIAGDGGCNNKPPSIAHQPATQLQTYNTCYAGILSVKVAVAVMKDIGGRPRKLHDWGEMWRCGCRMQGALWSMDAWCWSWLLPRSLLHFSASPAALLSCISLHHHNASTNESLGRKWNACQCTVSDENNIMARVEASGNRLERFPQIYALQSASKIRWYQLHQTFMKE